MSENFYINELRSFEKELDRVQEIRQHHSFLNRDMEMKEELFAKIDDVLLYTYHVLQSSSFQLNIRRQIIKTGMSYRVSIDTLQDMEKLSIGELTVIAEQFLKKNRMVSAIQGSITGVGHLLLLASDLPFILVSNMQLIQTLGYIFGHEMHNPREMMLALKVFYASVLPKKHQYSMWQELKADTDGRELFVDFEKGYCDEKLFDLLIPYFCKIGFIRLTSRKRIKRISILSELTSVFSRIYVNKKVGQFALSFYQYRYLKNKGFSV
ncbi:EcsC family protein [Salinibacillus xinjiangensis]|uniref:EcsC family protein n=1 Tax=Salinibacillus xinjiangensis TaxID=1229268 RepID=A0A6G1X9X2_9BACI|nr:EcsC family protein [Salinibacillus xinjiangensis]MRG87705.1 hypothetical protein [Salinibacillus xinjiangensis]